MVPLKWGMRHKEPNPHYYKISGSYSPDPELGPYQPTGYRLSIQDASVFHLGDGAAVTFSTDIPYDQATIYCESKHDSGALAVSIDGQDRGVACPSTSNFATAHLFTVKLESSTHSASVVCHGSAGCYLYAMGGTMPTGVRINNQSLGGGSAETMGMNRSQFAFADLMPGRSGITIVEHITNEPGNGINRLYYAFSLARIASHGRKRGGSVLLLCPGQDAIPGQTPYRAVMKLVAQVGRLSILDMHDLWGDAVQPKYFRTDLSHENKLGNLEIYRALTSYLARATVTSNY